jgi:hypothetical protein
MHLLELVQKGNDGLLLALNTLASNPNESFSIHGAACVNAVIVKAMAEPRSAPE